MTYFSKFIDNSKVPPLIFFAFFIAVSIYGFITLYDESFLTNDGAQYLSVAKNFKEGRGFVTSLIYYDAHYQIGGIPVEQTVWPPGYPFLIAFVSMLGISYQYAAFLISLVCFSLNGILIYHIAKQSGQNDLTCLSLSTVWFFLVINWFNILGCMSEMSFTLFTLISVACIIRSEKNWRNFWIVAAGGAATLAFTIRYTGIFFIISMVIFFSCKFLLQRGKRLYYEILVFSIFPFFAIIILFGRNYLLIGNFRGNSTLAVKNSLNHLLYGYYYNLSNILGFSEEGLSHAKIPEILLGTFACFFLILLLTRKQTVKINKLNVRKLFFNEVVLLSVIYILITIMFLSKFRALDYRFLIPVIPFCLLLIGVSHIFSLDAQARKILKVLLLGGIFVVFLAGQTNVFLKHWKNNIKKLNEYRKIYYSLTTPFGSDYLLNFLKSNVSLKNPLLGNSPQLLGAILDRPVIGLTPSMYTSKIWSNNEVREIITKYHVSYVLFIPDLFDEIDSNQIFFSELHKGNFPPWLTPFFSSKEVFVYQVTH